jgi:hypothetical protein
MESGLSEYDNVANIGGSCIQICMSASFTTTVAIMGWCAAPALCVWLVFDGLRNGVVRAKGGTYSRIENPKWYWACISLYTGLIIWFGYLTIKMTWGY